jgi:hypothetical protein
VPLPFAFEHRADAALGLGVDQVDPHRLRLQESLDAVDRLDEVVELEADAEEDRPGAVALEIAARCRPAPASPPDSGSRRPKSG